MTALLERLKFWSAPSPTPPVSSTRRRAMSGDPPLRPPHLSTTPGAPAMTTTPEDARTMLERAVTLPDDPSVTAAIDRAAATLRDWYAAHGIDVADPVTGHAILAGLALGVGTDRPALGVLVAAHLTALADHREPRP